MKRWQKSATSFERQRDEELRIIEEQQQKESATKKTLPTISLSKPSLRRRLVAYYSLISPETIKIIDQWYAKFDLIYEKFGGSVEGERLLSAKLVKKYGDGVMLLTCDPKVSLAKANEEKNKTTNKSEDWFQLRPEECGSGVLDFTSTKFDPLAALEFCGEKHIPNLMLDAPILDNIHKVRVLLPNFDPERVLLSDCASKKACDDNKNKKQKLIPELDMLSQRFEEGPLSMLHSCHVKRQRVRVLIRYKRSVRGTLTGYVIGFDKHMNIIMRDVDELFRPLFSSAQSIGHLEDNRNISKSVRLEISKTEVRGQHIDLRNMMRNRTATTNDDEHRNCIKQSEKLDTLRLRHFKKLMVRGDNIVMMWKA